MPSQPLPLIQVGTCRFHDSLALMPNHPPDPKILKRKLRDIKLRYDAQGRDAARHRRSRGMAAIRLSELTRWLDDQFGQGVELDSSDENVILVRIVAHHLGALPDAPRRIHKWCDIYAPWLTPRSLERLITEVTGCPLKWSADKLAWKIRLTDETRTRLKIKTIGAIDCSKAERAAKAKARRKERDAARRPPKQPPRGKPWIALGISRRTWYRKHLAQTRT